MTTRTLTQEYLKSILNYNPETGVLTWAIFKNARAQIGDVAGTKDSKGYIQIRIDNRFYRAHRIIWIYVYGETPTHNIDHIDGNRSNNAISNLRLASVSQNNQNRKRNEKSSTQYKGIYLVKKSGKFVAQIKKNRVHHYLGLFDTPEEAHSAYCKKAKELFGEFARFK